MEVTWQKKRYITNTLSTHMPTLFEANFTDAMEIYILWTCDFTIDTWWFNKVHHCYNPFKLPVAVVAATLMSIPSLFRVDGLIVYTLHFQIAFCVVLKSPPYSLFIHITFKSLSFKVLALHVFLTLFSHHVLGQPLSLLPSISDSYNFLFDRSPLERSTCLNPFKTFRTTPSLIFSHILTQRLSFSFLYYVSWSLITYSMNTSSL